LILPELRDEQIADCSAILTLRKIRAEGGGCCA
jgi:hypothetical protein